MDQLEAFARAMLVLIAIAGFVYVGDQAVKPLARKKKEREE